VCGRFVSSSPPDELARYFGAAPPGDPPLSPNYNVAPTVDVYAVMETAPRVEPGGEAPPPDRGPEAGEATSSGGGAVRRVEAFHWGLVPGWAKDLSVGNRMINARSETIATKNAFRRPFARRRCIIPADGFYEWTKVPGHRKKQPYFIHRTDDEPLAFAGLWEVWRGPKDNGAGGDGAGGADDGEGEERPFIRSCTIITTSANETMAAIHDRMPVILPPSAWDAWLDPANDDVESLGRLLVPAPPELITMHPVSIEVSNVRNKGPHLTEPVTVIDPDGRHDVAPGQGTLLEPNG
jgi:putative SOS response-associated peptidase YedK